MKSLFVGVSLVVTFFGILSKGSAAEILPHLQKYLAQEIPPNNTLREGVTEHANQLALEFLELKNAALGHEADSVEQLQELSKMANWRTHHFNSDFYVGQIEELFESDKIGPEGRNRVVRIVDSQFQDLSNLNPNRLRLWNLVLKPLQPEFLAAKTDSYFAAHHALLALKNPHIYMQLAREKDLLPLGHVMRTLASFAQMRLNDLTRVQGKGEVQINDFGLQLLSESAFDTALRILRDLGTDLPRAKEILLPFVAQMVAEEDRPEVKEKLQTKFLEIEMNWRERTIVDRVLSRNPVVETELCRLALRDIPPGI